MYTSKKLPNGRFMFLLSENIIPTMDLPEGQNEWKNDKFTGEKVAVYKYVSPLTNCCKHTANGNLFERDELEPSMQKKGFVTRLANNNFTGEYQHPSRNDPERYLQVFAEKESHYFNRFWFESIDGDDVLMGEVETATHDFGPELRKKILRGAIPAKSYRGAGELFTNDKGQTKKDLNSITWDNVFLPAEGLAWARKSSIQRYQYGESVLKNIKEQNEIYSEANNTARKVWTSCDYSIIKGIFNEIEASANFYAEAFGGATPTKVGVTKSGIVGFQIAECVTVLDKKTNAKLAMSIRDFISKV